MKRHRGWMVALAVAGALACARNEDDGGGGGGGADARRFDARESADGAGGADASAPADARVADAASIDVLPSPVVFNEVNGQDPDWIELFNTDAGAIDLSGYTVADTLTGTTMPDPKDSFTFPSGTVVESGAFLFLREDVTAGPSTECAPSPATSCFTIAFGVSSSNGETVFLLAPGGAIVGSLFYPTGVTLGQTIGRSPDGSGAPVEMTPSPGVGNTPPI